MITELRLTSQQLVNPKYNDPKELVGWMGAIQAQDYDMAKWAIGLRLQSPCNKEPFYEFTLCAQPGI